MVKIVKLNANVYTRRKVGMLTPYTLCITLPKQISARDFIKKGMDMLVIGKSRIFVIVPLEDYEASPYLQEKIEQFFNEEKM